MRALDWYYDPFHGDIALSFLCRTCYCYWFRVGVDRPSFLFNQQSPQNGSCSNCEATTFSRWRLHLKIQCLILCNCCYMWLWDYGEDRPREVWIRQRDGKVCIKCGSIATRKWRPIRYSSGQATADYQCASCAKKQQIEEDNLIRRWGCYRCYLYGVAESPEWPSSRTCQSCYSNKNSDNGLKQRRERDTCMNCNVGFGSKIKRQWNAKLKQWFCNACEKGISEHGCFRVTAIHLKGLAIRCEACNALWAERWRLFAKDPISNKSHGRVLCGRCFAKCEKTPAKVNTPGAIKFEDRTHYEPRIGPALKDIKFQDMMNKRKRLCQNHILVEYLERTHGIVLKIEMMQEIRVQKHMDLLWAR